MPIKFLTGGDISLLTKMEDLGQVYRDGGQPRDLLEIFRARGCNCMRLRLWVGPSGEDIFVNDLAYTLALGRRIKEAGLDFLLDFHYADTWADPGAQPKPAAWANLPFDALAAQVHDYSRDVITALRLGGAMPDIVQIGNEITPGMLWPEGRAGGEHGFKALAALLRAGIAGVEAGAQAGAGAHGPQIMIHCDRGGDSAGTEAFYDGITSQGVPYDLIGLSFYPFWHGPLPRLEETLEDTARRYGKPIIVVETGYHYAGEPDKLGMTYPITPQGQRQFLEDLVAAVRRTPDGLGRGVLYWAPEWLAIDGLRSSWADQTLFDAGGHALPGLDSLGGEG